MATQSSIKTNSEITCGQRMKMILCPCLYICKPEMASVDCYLCYHETQKTHILNIPPLIQMSSTWLNYDLTTPIPFWFYTLRNFLTLGLIIITMYNLSIYILHDIVVFWPIYFTQWNILLATISMIIKSISTNEVYKFIKLNSTISSYSHQLKPYTKLWTLYVIDNILLQITIASQPMVVLSYWFIVFPGWYDDTMYNISICLVHGGGFILIFIDSILSAERSHYKSSIWPILFAVIWGLWSIIFEIAGLKDQYGNKYIYSFSDWSEGVVIPIIMLVITSIIYVAITSLLTFIKNLILIDQGFGQRCIQIMRENEDIVDNHAKNGEKRNEEKSDDESVCIEYDAKSEGWVIRMVGKNKNCEEENNQQRTNDVDEEHYGGESVNDSTESGEWSIKISVKVVDEDDEDDEDNYELRMKSTEL